MNYTRRSFLRASLAAGTVAIATGAGLLIPRSVLAAWPKNAFEAKTMDEAMKDIAGATSAPESADIIVEAPDIAENGAVVTVTITTKLANVEQISLLVPKNTTPLIASYILTSNTDGFVTSRIKMRETSDVIAVVKSGNKLFSAKKPVKVTLGGCGG
ncbi:MAG: thiosulfate oxidation carrier protein SoxY [Gammaproteobacteria bacterium]|nr:thiosulfate oxidation carrier protein SoxY [Gammaproteobacteria bacterium]